MRTVSLTFTLLFFLSSGCKTTDQWIVLFDGQTLDGWKASEQEGSFRVEDGAIVCDGPRSHLFYVGDELGEGFRNFEFEAEVKTTPGSNSGIYFHTEFQEDGWPAKGYEAQVLNSNRPSDDLDSWVEHKKTGSLYAIRNTWKAPAVDNEWFKYRILVQGKTVQIFINGNLIVDYTESQAPPRPTGSELRLLDKGTFALQCHDPESIVFYRDLKVRRLPDDLPTPGKVLEDEDLEKTLIELSHRNFPLMDLHVHLKQDLTLEQALENARLYGFTYGIAINCGLQMPYPDDEAVQQFLNSYEKPPQTFLAMQAEGREWTDIYSEELVESFDFVFTDAMTWSNNAGKRMRLWIEEEVEIGDVEEFMETLVDRTEAILNDEPIDIFVNPTYLPEAIKDSYDELWTEERMERVVNALAVNQVAFEINAARSLPSPAFIKLAKEKGVKFTFGTNNGGKDDLGHLEYCLQMIKECSLEPSDMWIPKTTR